MRPIHIFLLLSAVALLAGLYKTFEKAGEKGWKALIPGYNFLIWLRIIQRPWWWIFLVLIPTVGFYMLAVMIVLLSNGFGKRKFSQHVLAVLGYFIWVPYLGFSKDVKWEGMPVEDKKAKKPWAKEWGEAAVFAVIAATLIRTFFFEAFVIPSSSMEGTLLVGDYLFVSKMSYGAKVPSIPLTVPFTHNTLPFTETTPSYLDWVELPYMRLPALSDVKRNDIVVFNFPEGDTVWKSNRNSSYYQEMRDFAIARTGGNTDAIRKQWIENDEIVVHPVDKEDNYVKRCVGTPGDMIEVRNKVLYVNGQPAMRPQNIQYSYDVVGNINSETLAQSGIESQPGPAGYDLRVWVTDKELELLRPSVSKLHENIDVFDSVVAMGASFINGNTDPYVTNAYFEAYNVFPHRPDVYKWTRDNFGPLRIPKKGMTVHLTPDSISFWDRAIKVYEGNSLEYKNGQFILNGQPATTYTFKEDYYWMMGDNRHNSLDSRYWGYVPADHIVGKPVFVWFSKGDKTGYRPERMMAFVSPEGLSRSYLWWVVIGIAGIVGYNYWKGRKNEAANRKPAPPGTRKK